jgi:high-affinity iron transporter
LREWQSASRGKVAKDAANDAERRLRESQNRRAKSWMMAASVACLAVILVLSADFAYTRANSAPPAARPIAAVGNEVRVPLSDVHSNMHLFTVEIGGQSLRFMVIKKPNGYGTALDACRICGAEGYRQDGQNVVCRHCASAIYIPSIGDQGGCNPVGVASHIDGTDLVMDLSSLTRAASEVPK